MIEDSGLDQHGSGREEGLDSPGENWKNQQVGQIWRDEAWCQSAQLGQ